MSAAYILDAISERVVTDINAVNPSFYDLQDIGESSDRNLDTLIFDLMEPIFYQYCENRNFGTDNELELKMAINTFSDYIQRIILDGIIPDYDPEEDVI